MLSAGDMSAIQFAASHVEGRVVYAIYEEESAFGKVAKAAWDIKLSMDDGATAPMCKYTITKRE